jgi:hypothetical protein
VSFLYRIVAKTVPPDKDLSDLQFTRSKYHKTVQITQRLTEYCHFDESLDNYWQYLLH